MLRRTVYFLFATTLLATGVYSAGCAHVTPSEDQLDGPDGTAGGTGGSNGESGTAGTGGTAGSSGTAGEGAGGTAGDGGSSAGEGGTAGDGGTAGTNAGSGGSNAGSGGTGSAGTDPFGGAGGAAGGGGFAGGGGCGGNTLVINEVLLADIDDENAEYVEILNRGTCTVKLEGFSLWYMSGSGSKQSRWTGTSKHSVGAGEYFLLATDVFQGQDATMTAGLSAKNGALGLYLPKAKDPFDAVAWGSVTSPGKFQEGSAAAAPEKGLSLSRIPNGIDTGNNASDFDASEQTPGDANY